MTSQVSTISSDDPSALFVDHGATMVPTSLSRGPWRPDALHGGPVAALLTRAMEQVTGDDGLQLVRVTVELVRPVPLQPLTVEAHVIRPGRRVQLVEATMGHGDVEVAKARALRIRISDTVGDIVPSTPEDSAPPSFDRLAPFPSSHDPYQAFHNDGVEYRFVTSAFDQVGPALVWIRLAAPVVAGEVPTPWQRTVAVADFGNGVSAEFPMNSMLFINPDLTVTLHRPPTGEWICLDARTRFGTAGIGLAESALWDASGRIGRSVQSLLVDRLE